MGIACEKWDRRGGYIDWVSAGSVRVGSGR